MEENGPSVAVLFGQVVSVTVKVCNVETGQVPVTLHRSQRMFVIGSTEGPGEPVEAAFVLAMSPMQIAQGHLPEPETTGLTPEQSAWLTVAYGAVTSLLKSLEKPVLDG